MNAWTTMALWVAVAAAGGCGAVLRFVVDGEVARLVTSRLPLGTMVVNLSGAFVLGLLDGRVLSASAALIVGTGVLGAYTTFSTWMLETQRLAEERQSKWALANIALSLLLGIAAAAAGLWIGRHL